MITIVLSKNFLLTEFTSSYTAYCKKISNVPSEAVIYRLSFGVFNLLQPLRDFLKKPIRVTSGYRSTALNTAVGGSPTSQHTTGNAADIVLSSDDDYSKAIDFLLKQPFCDQLINEYKGKSRWLHISWSLKPRHQYLTQVK